MNGDGEKNQLPSNDFYKQILEAIRTEANKTRQEIKDEIKLENAKVLTNIRIQNEKIENIENKCNKLEADYRHLQRQYRKNNIIIFGLKVDTNPNLIQFIIDNIKGLLGIDIAESDINNIYKLGTDKETPIKLEFVSYLKKDLILKNSRKLKGTKISIAQDLCPEDRKDVKVLQSHLKLAKSKNHFAKIKGFKLIIDDNLYTAEQLRRLDEQDSTSDENELNTENILKSSHSAPATSSQIAKTGTNRETINDEVFSEKSIYERNLMLDTDTRGSPCQPPEKRTRDEKKNSSTSSSTSTSTSTKARTTRATQNTGKLTYPMGQK